MNNGIDPMTALVIAMAFAGTFMAGMGLGIKIGRLQQLQADLVVRLREAEDRFNDFWEEYNQAQAALIMIPTIEPDQPKKGDLILETEIANLERLYRGSESKDDK